MAHINHSTQTIKEREARGAAIPYALQDILSGTYRRYYLTLCFILLVVSILALACAALGMFTLPIGTGITLTLFTLVNALLIYLFFRHDFQRPLEKIKFWADNIELGQLDTRVELSGDTDLVALSNNINNIGKRLHALYLRMDDEIEEQTERIAQKNKSLQVLYDVAASINASRDIDDLLTRFLHTMRDQVSARAGTVRLLNGDNDMELVANIGFDDEAIKQERVIPAQQCRCGNAVAGGEVLFQSDLCPCNRLIGSQLIANGTIGMVAVPLHYRGKNLGVYNLFVEHTHSQNSEEIKALLTSVGRHLGMAIEKAHLDNEAKRLYIVQERNTLAHEIHDSLAQTLASLRFQVSMLDSTFDQQDAAANRQEIQQIKSGLNEAYSELRELLAHFRAPIDKRGLIPALEDLVSSFRQQTGMHVLLQNKWGSTQLPANLEMQVLRIVQEAMANIRKHSQAHTVRILLRCERARHYTVLVEDDGVGMDRPAFSGHPGEHLGLSIMQERARYLGGELHIESETGEGTQVLLTFCYPAASLDSREPHHFALI